MDFTREQVKEFLMREVEIKNKIQKLADEIIAKSQDFNREQKELAGIQTCLAEVRRRK